ncbi:hypothetical protein SARC_03232 [Sphaeroforma arctica JP610]|uniref:FHA domain-containing protein n=1 Tax=Sphaeroforma arctica JP610 TaxID=667725 RepID=A0A0L0G6K9_9EUKA|nr:hypothetical protein SARC_03232 [Sphaeroforma arctica JP610]KNC84559.1 hypothetical protein SARC_03232 [Sphaeroforma arctica JP610]|eukprot:XP_014158461.1 hypothetical protein SARC_03232 [Sphaeroforma arctica JP610]
MPDSRLVAYAKIIGTDFEFFMQTLSIIIGRTAAVSLTTEPSHLDVDLTGYDGIDTRHCTIMYNFDREMFELKVLSETHPVQVNDLLLKKSSRPHMLRSKDLVIVGDAHFYFLLPQGEVTHERSPHDLSKSNSMPRNPPLLKSKDMFVPSGSPHPRGLVPQQDYHRMGQPPVGYAQQSQQPPQHPRHPPLHAIHSQPPHGSYGNADLQPAPPTHRGDGENDGEGSAYSTHQQVQRQGSAYSNDEQQSPYPSYRTGPESRPPYSHPSQLHAHYGPSSQGGYQAYPSQRQPQGGSQSQTGSYNGSPLLRQSQYPPTSPQSRPVATMYSGIKPHPQQQQRPKQYAQKKKRKATGKNAEATPRKKKKEKMNKSKGQKDDCEREPLYGEEREIAETVGWSATNSADQSYASSAEEDIDSTTEDEGHVEAPVKQMKTKPQVQILPKKSTKKAGKGTSGDKADSEQQRIKSRAGATVTEKSESKGGAKKSSETKRKTKSKNVSTDKKRASESVKQPGTDSHKSPNLSPQTGTPTPTEAKASEPVYYDGDATPDNTIVQVAVAIKKSVDNGAGSECHAAETGQEAETKAARMATQDNQNADTS